MFLQNVDTHLQVYMTWQLKRPPRTKVTHCLHLQPWRWRLYVPPEHCYPPASIHDFITQKTTTDNFTAIRSSNDIHFNFQHLSFISDIYKNSFPLQQWFSTFWRSRPHFHSWLNSWPNGRRRRRKKT
jgi:hypothetical protein